MKEYECKDIIKSINDKRKNLRETVLVGIVKRLEISRNKINDNNIKNQIGNILDQIPAESKHWLENDFPEINYNPNIETRDPTTGPGPGGYHPKPNPDDNVVITGPWHGNQKAIGPAKSMLGLPPHTYVLNKKDKEVFDNCLYTVKENTGLCFNEFVSIAKKYMDDEKEFQKQTVNPENIRLKQHRIDLAKNNIKSMTTILSNITVDMPLGGTASKIIIKKISDISQDEDTKNVGERLSYKFMEFIFYSSLRYILTKDRDPKIIFEALNANKSKLINYIRFFDDDKSVNRANDILNVLINTLMKAE